MEIHLWNVNGNDITVELSGIQEEAIFTILGLEANPDGKSYSCYTDEVVTSLVKSLKVPTNQ